MGKTNEENVKTGQQETNEPWKKPDRSDHHPDKDSSEPTASTSRGQQHVVIHTAASRDRSFSHHPCRKPWPGWQEAGMIWEGPRTQFPTIKKIPSKHFCGLVRAV